MEDIKQEKEIVFTPDKDIKNEDISFDFKNFELDEKELINVNEYYNKYEEFISDQECRELFEDYLDVKKTNINEIISNPLYFLKKIIYFYKKETLLDCYFLKLRLPPKNNPTKIEKELSFKVNINKDNDKAFLSFDLQKKSINALIEPDKKAVSFLFNIQNDNINIPIKSYDENNKEIILTHDKRTKSKKQNLKKIKFPERNISGSNNNNNSSQDDVNKLNQSQSDKNSILYNISKKNFSNYDRISSSSSISFQKENNNDDLTSKTETLISYNENEFNIIVKENNDNLLYIFNREKIGGETFEFTTCKIFELICNISLNRNIKVKNYGHKNPDKINNFFNLEGQNKINTFQIDLYIPILSGKELNQIYQKFPNNFFFFQDLNLNEFDKYEIIGEISQNIINNSRQKISQQFNYIHLIKNFNQYEKKDDNKFISLCRAYDLTTNEKIFILLTDGSYIRLKYLISIMKKNIKEIENAINEKKSKKEIISILSMYLEKKQAKKILNIDIEKFYNICIFYNNLKISGIKFCFCFISDIIEDKLENIIEEGLKLCINNNIYDEQNIISDNTDNEEEKQKNEGLKKSGKDSKKGKFGNDLILNIIEMIKKNDKLKSNLRLVTDDINKEINKFVSKKNEELKKLEQFFLEYSKKNVENFFCIAQKINKSMKGQELLIKKIYLNQIYFLFIFFIPNKFELNIQKIKNNIDNCEKGFLFDIIQIDNSDEIDKYIKSKNIKNKVVIKIIISNEEDRLNYFRMFYKNVYYFENNLDLPIGELIKNNFDEAKTLYINEFYQKNKCFFPFINKNKEILSQNNIVEKIQYDLEILSIKNENNKLENIWDNFSFVFDFKNKEDNILLKIGNDYYDSLIEMIKKLLIISKIRRDNNVLDFFLDKKKYQEEFINLTENIKCKCFYKFFLLSYLEKNILINEELNFPKIIKLEELLKEKHK